MVSEFVNSDMGKWLPVSPIQKFLHTWDGLPVIQKYLGYVNWFLPVSTVLEILTIWLVAIGFFYGFMALMRYLNIVD